MNLVFSVYNLDIGLHVFVYHKLINIEIFPFFLFYKTFNAFRNLVPFV